MVTGFIGCADPLVMLADTELYGHLRTSGNHSVTWRRGELPNIKQ
jgi:hypothetical protein